MATLEEQYQDIKHEILDVLNVCTEDVPKEHRAKIYSKISSELLALAIECWSELASEFADEIK